MNPNRFKLLIVSICLLFAACAHDPQEIGPPDKDFVTISFEVGIPVANIPDVHTRSLTPADERMLHQVDILLFESDGTTERFAARTHNTNNLTADGREYQTITANFEVDDSKLYRLVILANLRNEVDAVLDGNIEGEIKESVLRQIIYSHNERWPSKDHGTSFYRPLPMWGEAANITAINKNTTSSSFGTIRLLRSQALIQLAVNIPQTGGGVSNGKDFFEIEEVKVYNAHRDGYAVPLPSALYNGQKVESPSIASQNRIDADDMRYVMSDINPYHENALYNTIYVNECVNAGVDMADAMYLIIKGYYTEPGAGNKNTTVPSWYRVDFYDRAMDHPDADRINILRNHSYLVNINHIGGPGEDDEQTAKNTLPVQMKVDIVGWSDGQTTDVAWNGMYMLGVSKSHFELNNYGHGSEMFTVITNYPKGWTASVESGDSWIDLHSPSTFTGINTQDEFYFDVAANTGNPERIGYIILRADNIELKVKVEQSDDEITIEIVDFSNIPVTERIFYSPKPTYNPVVPAQLFIIRWTPADRNVFVSEDILTNVAFDFRQDNGITHGEKLTGGFRGYTIAPPEITEAELIDDPFLEKASRFYFTLGDETPYTTNITLRHIMINLVTDHDEDKIYEMDGSVQQFNVRSNTAWEVSVSDPDGVLFPIYPLEKTSGGYNTDGEVFRFRMADNSGGTHPGGTAVITFSYFNAYGETLTHKVEITAEGVGRDLAVPRTGISSNCYLLKPGGKGVTIPVSRANEALPGSIASGQQLGWEFIWTDHPNGYDKNGDEACPVRLIELQGEGTEAIMAVYPGTEPGNAVIAVTNNSGQILWSWHIWVSEFDPDNDTDDYYGYRYYRFMDRNLGALSDVPGTVEFMGLNYQWGRKDPFPHAITLNGSTFTPIYDKNGNAKTLQSVSNNQAAVMLEYAVRNPATFIRTSDDWYSTNWSTYVSTERVNMWHPAGNNNLSDDTKSVYDPCPEGWRVVPGSTTNTNSEWYILFSNKQYDSANNYTTVSGYNSFINEYVDLGIWPHSGVITGSNMTLAQVGSNGRYWTANADPSGVNSIHTVFYPNNTSTDVAINLARSNALPVRCMRRVE